MASAQYTALSDKQKYKKKLCKTLVTEMSREANLENTEKNFSEEK